ncbi:MAG: arginine--tRNA ligase, partial [Rubrobacteraceae bacterium]
MSFEERIAGAVREAARAAYGVELDGVYVERPSEVSHGDFASNVALANAKVFRRNPREVAEGLREALDESFVDKVEVAGPGFLNFWLSPDALWGGIEGLLREGEDFGRRESSGVPVLLEFVSANPTGPMHVAHGRHAAFGDSLARIMAAAGMKVSREYYFNDGGNQIRLLGESVAVPYAKLHGEEWLVDDETVLYQGEYIQDIARNLSEQHGDEYLRMDREEAMSSIVDFATDWCMADIKRTLGRTRVRFDRYFNEKNLYESGVIETVIEALKERGHVYGRDGALWLDSSTLGDDKDRVLVKRDGSYTYMAPDVAYHRDKYERGFGTAVDILGADHAGYPPRIRAGLLALGLPGDFLDVELVRLVKLMRAGEQVKVSKRAGNIVALDELLDEVGVDVARYFYVRSSHRTEMNFDLELAVKQSDENPVFYVQYAHARIASIFERAGMSVQTLGDISIGQLAPEERALALELLDFPRVVRNAATKREVHPIPT